MSRIRNKKHNFVVVIHTLFLQLICQKGAKKRRKSMAWIIAFCTVVVMWLDYLFIKQLRLNSKAQRRWLYMLLTVDILPIAGLTPLYLFSPVSILSLGHVSQWMMFIFIILGVARQPFNIAYLISHNRWIRMLGVVCSLIFASIFIYGTVVTRTDYTINRITINSDRLPASFDGYKIVLFSDLHIKNLVCATKEISDVVDICNSLEPDMITFCGDLVDVSHIEVTHSIATELRKLKAKDGVFSVTGNHDIGVYIRDSIRLTPKENTHRLIAKEQEMGWRVLDNETEYIRQGNDSIAITGISFAQSLQEDRHSADHSGVKLDSLYSTLSKELFNITLSHMPQLWDNIIKAHPADLTLAGHVHAMQIALKVGQWRISPSMLLYKRWSGLYKEGEQYLYINDGIGYGLYPTRIGARPEITLFELRRNKNHN